MTLPFTVEEFFEVMRAYNEGVWPAQLGLAAVGSASVALLALRGEFASRAISAGLALLWAWAALAYHLGYFYHVNPAAPLFAALFLVGAALFAWHGVVRGRLRFERFDAQSALGGVLIAYALLVYPALAIALGHAYPQMATFGLPCPTTIFTLGLAAFLRPPVPGSVLLAPLAWVLIGSQAALLFGMYEDLGMLAAGAAGVWFAFGRFRQARRA